jgi:hypothetical protein
MVAECQSSTQGDANAHKKQEQDTHQVHEELLHPLVHDLVVLPAHDELLQQELVVLLAERGQDRGRQVVGDRLSMRTRRCKRETNTRVVPNRNKTMQTKQRPRVSPKTERKFAAKTLEKAATATEAARTSPWRWYSCSDQLYGDRCVHILYSVLSSSQIHPDTCPKSL